MKVVIFLGPSLPLETARRVLDATYLPPARQGDLLSATVNFQPDAIGLIDGVFLQSLSVWHKEILFALDRGVRVYGASSMGALRAAETASFGVVGVGEIFRMYADGTLIDDDEVALAHGEADSGYARSSEPMVNVRATLQAAVDASVLGPDEFSVVIAAAKRLYFVDRSFPAIFAEARAAGLDARTIDALARHVKTAYVDLKAQDARLLLETIRDSVGQPPPAPEPARLRRTAHFDTLYNRDRTVPRGPDEVVLEDIANFAAIHEPGFHDLNFNALNRMLTQVLGHFLDVHPTAEDIDAEERRLRVRRGCETDEQLTAWLARNNLAREDFRQLMTEMAMCRRLHRWYMVANWMGRTTRPVLDQLRLEGRYEALADRAAARERVLQRAEGQAAYTRADKWRIPLRRLVEEHAEWTEWAPDTDLTAWIDEAGFHGDAEFRMELLRSHVMREELLRALEQDAGEEDPAGPGEGE